VDPGSKRLRVTVTDDRGRAARAPGLAAWLTRVAPARARGDLAIAIVSDARIRALNKQFRRKNEVTDVLSFSSDAPRASRLDPRILGDIVIAAGVARRQARDAGHAYGTEVKVLALHGLLHLLGYDHHDPADRGRMGRLERQLRRQGGLPAGLIERAPSTRSGWAEAPAARARAGPPTAAAAVGWRRRSGAARSAAAERARAGVGPRDPSTGSGSSRARSRDEH
jgi:probable rRNA maturation factor